MNARTCQLCGKPLSRLRVGGDGDFCSREHRNQHRLRCGMDRLEEANKVTSLMRRRENPRHISAARLMCNSAQDRRGFFEAKHPTGQDRHSGLSPGSCPLPPRRVSPVAQTGMWRHGPRVWPQASHRGERTRPASASMVAAPLPSSSASPSEAARYRFPRRRSSPCAAIPRRQAPRRAISECCAEAKFAFTSAPPWRQGAWSPPRTRAGTPGSSAQGCICRRRRQCAAGLDWHRLPRSANELARLLQPAAVARRAGVAAHSPPHFARVATIPLPITATWKSESPSGALVCPRWPTELAPPDSYSPEPSRRATAGRPTAPTRQAHHGYLWKPSEPRSRAWRCCRLPPDLPRATARIFLLIALTPTITSAHTATSPSRLSSRRNPWAARRSPLKARWPRPLPARRVRHPVAPRMTVEPAIAATSRPAGAVVRIEEHFGSGWDDWVGGMKDWLVDVAGVRTGSLALFVSDVGTDRLRVGFSRANRHAQSHLGCARGGARRIPALHAHRGRRGRTGIQPLRRRWGVAQPPVIAHSACPANRAPP